MKNDSNALIDVKMNENSDVKIFSRRATFIQRATSIPDSRVHLGTLINLFSNKEI